MTDKITMADQEDSTARYLRTNGPPPGAFEPDVPHYAMEGSTEREKYLLEMASKGDKQNRWVINEIIGLKGAHRVIHARLEDGDKKISELETVASIVKDWRAKWLTGKRKARNIIIAIITIALLPSLGIFIEDAIKHFLHW